MWFYWGIGILDISEKGNSLWFIERFLIYRVNMFTVYRQANNINMLKDGMKIEATHVKKKQLHHYLPAEILQKKKKVGLLAYLQDAAMAVDPETKLELSISSKPLWKEDVDSRSEISLITDICICVLRN